MSFKREVDLLHKSKWDIGVFKSDNIWHYRVQLMNLIMQCKSDGDKYRVALQWFDQKTLDDERMMYAINNKWQYIVKHEKWLRRLLKREVNGVKQFKVVRSGCGGGKRQSFIVKA